MSVATMLETEAMKYAADAVRYDKLGDKDKAADSYKKAVEQLTRLIKLYPDYTFNKFYVEKVTTYQERIRLLKSDDGEETGIEKFTSFETKQTGSTIQQEPEDTEPSEKPNVTWGEVAGLEDAKRAIKEVIVYPVKRPDLFPLGWSRGLLLFGPPGCGKTLLAAAVANEIEAQFIQIDPANIMSKWLGAAEQNVAKIFGSARRTAMAGTPVIIFMDEVDSILGVHTNEVGGEVRMRNQFLKEMDGLQDKGKNYHLYVVAATNKPWDLDWAFIRRFQKRVMVPLPDYATRLQMFEINCAQLELTPDVDFHVLTQLTEGYSGSDIKDICQVVRQEVIRELFESGKAEDPGSRPRLLSMDDFKRAVSNRRPSVSADMIKEYDKWFEQFKAL
ncbi:MAG: AAA family ATPase [Candidatus Bathyarchaeota archaeon]|nr:AAA family ATPase [Candidatus Bathyarchaeota archaeon]